MEEKNDQIIKMMGSVNLEERDIEKDLKGTSIHLVKKIPNALKIINKEIYMGYDGYYYAVNSNDNSKKAALNCFNKAREKGDYVDRRNDLVNELQNIFISNVVNDEETIKNACKPVIDEMRELQKEVLHSNHKISDYANNFCVLEDDEKAIVWSSNLIWQNAVYKSILGTKEVVDSNSYIYRLEYGNMIEGYAMKMNYMRKAFFDNIEWLDSDDNGKYVFAIAYEGLIKKKAYAYVYFDLFKRQCVKYPLAGFVKNSKDFETEPNKRIRMEKVKVKLEPETFIQAIKKDESRFNPYYIVKYDKISKNWLIINYQGSAGDEEQKIKCYILTENNRVYSIDFTTEKFKLTHNTKFEFYNNRLYVPRNGRISIYTLEPNQDVSEEIAEAPGTEYNSKLVASDDGNSILICERNYMLSLDI